MEQPDKWEISANEIIMENLLEEGGVFGEVYTGVIKCQITNPKVRPPMKNFIFTSVHRRWKPVHRRRKQLEGEGARVK